MTKKERIISALISRFDDLERIGRDARETDEASLITFHGYAHSRIITADTSILHVRERGLRKARSALKEMAMTTRRNGG